MALVLVTVKLEDVDVTLLLVVLLMVLELLEPAMAHGGPRDSCADPHPSTTTISRTHISQLFSMAQRNRSPKKACEVACSRQSLGICQCVYMQKHIYV